jgi:uncharacterized protein (TIGR02145 family)
VQSLSPALGGSGNTAYLWLRTGTSGATTLTGNAATYAIGAGDYSAAGMHYFNRYAKDATCTDWVAAAGTYTLLAGVNQQQGGCAFTQPDVVGTFATFDPEAVSPSTFVTLMDERDGNNYTVVKVGERWIMAQSLNYQKDLYFNERTNQANGSTFTSTTNGAPGIGSFWCPGVNGAATSTRANCNYWGALYTWETAMMLDGNGTWEGGNLSYCGNTCNSDVCKTNWGRNANSGTVTGGRGICPERWHVPTDYEWGIILNAMEENTSTAHTAASSSAGQYGVNAGRRGKSTCTGAATDTNPYWNTHANHGTDIYGFRMLPVGQRAYDGKQFEYRGVYNPLWSSSPTDGSKAWTRRFDYDTATVYRGAWYRSTGYNVRCIKD